MPRKPIAPFKTISPGRSVDIEVDFRAIVTKELKPGPVHIQVIAENWPSYSDNYVAKLKQAWHSHGLLWAHSLLAADFFYDTRRTERGPNSQHK